MGWENKTIRVSARQLLFGSMLSGVVTGAFVGGVMGYRLGEIEGQLRAREELRRFSEKKYWVGSTGDYLRPYGVQVTVRDGSVACVDALVTRYSRRDGPFNSVIEDEAVVRYLPTADTSCQMPFKHISTNVEVRPLEGIILKVAQSYVDAARNVRPIELAGNFSYLDMMQRELQPFMERQDEVRRVLDEELAAVLPRKGL